VASFAVNPKKQCVQIGNFRQLARLAVLERRKSEVSILRGFDEAGELVNCERLGDGIADIAELAKYIEGKGPLHTVALDPYGVGAIVDTLDEVGITGQIGSWGISQGWKLTGAIKTAERELADGSLRHSSRALMSWAVANARVEPKGNAIVITKQVSGTAKIDPLMAAFNAVAWMSANPASSQPSIFVI
jgi:phage terminase large subunit-like protein